MRAVGPSVPGHRESHNGMCIMYRITERFFVSAKNIFTVLFKSCSEGGIHFATQQPHCSAHLCLPRTGFPSLRGCERAYLSVLLQVVELDQVGVDPRAELLRVDVLLRRPGEVIHVVADARELLLSDLTQSTIALEERNQPTNLRHALTFSIICSRVNLASRSGCTMICSEFLLARSCRPSLIRVALKRLMRRSKLSSASSIWSKDLISPASMSTKRGITAGRSADNH